MKNVVARILGCSLLTVACGATTAAPEEARLPYAIVDTGQVRCYDLTREIAYPQDGERFFGQDAHYTGHEARYRAAGDGTVEDRVTGLTWQADPGPKRTWKEALAGAAACRLGGKRDWRLPTIKELYSLIRFDGTDPDPRSGTAAEQRPFLDAEVFAFRYGDPTRGERVIDAQYASSTKYVATTMRGDETVFGVNFADGRIKGYGLRDPRGRGEKTFFVLYVRGNPAYGRNDFHDLGDGTVEDRATGLVWMKQDSGFLGAGPAGDGRLAWVEALAWAEELEFAGHDDWRLPNAKELQSIVDYERSPATTNSPALDPVFDASPIVAEDGRKDYPSYWTSTTHARVGGGASAVYVAFGRALGWMPGRGGDRELLDVHGAGSQRSDPKAPGEAGAFPHGRGPQGDVVRGRHHARLVRGGLAVRRTEGPALEPHRPAVGPAESGSPPPGREAFVARLDRDGDGKVSREEFDGPAEHFRDFDRDGDGFIDADEAPTGPPPGDMPPPPRRR